MTSVIYEDSTQLDLPDVPTSTGRLYRPTPSAQLPAIQTDQHKSVSPAMFLGDTVYLYSTYPMCHHPLVQDVADHLLPPIVLP